MLQCHLLEYRSNPLLVEPIEIALNGAGDESSHIGKTGADGVMIVASLKIFLRAVLGTREDYDAVISVFHGNANVGFRRIGVALFLEVAQNSLQCIGCIFFYVGVNQVHIPCAVEYDAVAVAEWFCAVIFIVMILHHGIPLAEYRQFPRFARLKMSVKRCRCAAVS